MDIATWELIIRISHVVGTVLGVGGATFAEIFSIRALRDGKIDEVEGGFLKTTYSVIRWGAIILLISGFAFLLVNRLEGHEERLYSIRLWTKLILTVIIFVNAVLLQTRKIAFGWGAAISFVSWYLALVLGLWRAMPFEIWEIAVGYAGLIIVVYFALKIIRRKFGVKT